MSVLGTTIQSSPINDELFAMARGAVMATGEIQSASASITDVNTGIQYLLTVTAFPEQKVVPGTVIRIRTNE